MVNVTVQADRAIFDVEGLDRLWALRSRLEIPLAHIVDATSDPDQVGRWWHGVKMLGTDVPGVMAAGAFFYHRQMVFWDVHDPHKTVIVSLDHEFYRKLILEVADPHDVVARLNAARGA
jgi:hypothetical protein